MQCSQGLKHAPFTGVHGWHLVGSLTLSRSHVGFLPSLEPSQTNLPEPEGSSQYPKQSHPLGTKGAQKLSHWVDW